MSIGSLSLLPLIQTIFGGDSAKEVKAPEPEQKAASPKPSATSALDIAADYDMRHITPGEFSSLLTELKAAGHLSDGDFEKLSSLRAEFEKAGHGPDEPLDVLSFVRDRLTGQQALAAEAAQGAPDRVNQLGEALALWRQRAGWVEKLDALHHQDLGELTLDAMA